jgi:serine/threonine-protein kinase
VSAHAACGSPLAISHDGRTVAFAAADEGGHELGLVLRPLDALEVRPTRLGSAPLGTEGARSAQGNTPLPSDEDRFLSVNPFFSPDDRWLGFFQGTQLGRVLLAGGSPERVEGRTADVGLDTSLSAKGAAWTSAGIVVAPNVSSGLMRFPLDGGFAVGLSTLDAARGETSHRWPDLLPDGRHLLVSIKLRSLVTFDDANIAVTAVTVLRDVTMSPENGTAAFAIARNGTLVYVPGGPCRYDTRLVWTSPDGTQEPVDLPGGYYYMPVPSPDGTRVAVLLHGAYDTLYLHHLERKTLTRVTVGVNVESFVWDRDGDHLFVMFLDQDGGAIARVRADGTGEPQILYRRPSDVPIRLAGRQSVDGETVLLATVEGPAGSDIVLISVGANAEVTPVLATPSSEFDAAVSPDGRCLAYASMENGNSEVYVRPFPEGPGLTQISHAGGSQPSWSRDGKWLLYTPTAAQPDPRHRRVAVPTSPGDCFRLGTPTAMAAPPGERMLEIRDVGSQGRALDVVAIQGWADTLNSPASIATETHAAP